MWNNIYPINTSTIAAALVPDLRVAGKLIVLCLQAGEEGWQLLLGLLRNGKKHGVCHHIITALNSNNDN